MSGAHNVPSGTPNPAHREFDPQTPYPDAGSDSRAATDGQTVHAPHLPSAATAARHDPTPGMPPAGMPPQGAPTAGRRSGTKARALWSGIIVAAIVSILLLIFIVQNTTNVTIHFFSLSGRLPVAVALLFAAIAGILLLAIPGTIRMLQLRKAARLERAAHAAAAGAPTGPPARL